MVLVLLVAGALLVAFIVRPARSLRALLQVTSFVLAVSAGFTIYLIGPEPLFVCTTVVCGLTWLMASIYTPRR